MAQRQPDGSVAESIAFLGTGLLGGAFVEAALKRGESVAVWNRTAAKAHALETMGARFAATPADAVRGASRVHLVVKDDAAVESVIEALRPGLADGATIVDHTTTQPALTAERAKRLTAEGIRYLHCPVFVGPAGAREAKGTMLVSGSKPIYDAVAPALQRMVERVSYLGERPDVAAVHKLCGNAVWVVLTGLAADVLSIAREAGIDADEALRVADSLSQPGTIARQGERMASEPEVPAFELAMARKDVRLMQETAGPRPLAALDGVARRMDALIAQGLGEKDLTILGKDAGR
jgi:3-hydroxyisobutyrate dehydrogenase